MITRVNWTRGRLEAIRSVPYGYAARALRGLLATDGRTSLWAAGLGAGLIVVAGVLLSATLTIWLDEAFTLHTTGAGPVFAWEQAIAFEGQPPLYFVLESIWRMGGEHSILVARLPSVLFAAASVAVIVAAAHRIAPQTPPFVVALVTACNPIVLWAAVEMRVYALVLLAGAVLSWAFFEGFLVANPSRRARVWYVIFAIAGLYTQYYVGLVLFAHLITMAAMRRSAMRPFIGSMAIVVLAFAPFVGVALMHVATSGDFVTRVAFVRTIADVADAAFMYILPHDYLTGGMKFASFGLAAALLAVLFAFGRPAVREKWTRAVVVGWLGSLAVFTCIFAAAGVPADLLRHLIVVVPSSLLVAVLFFSSLTRVRLVAGGLAVTVFAVFAFTQLWARYHPPFLKLGDWQRVAATIRADDGAAPIAVFPAELATPLSYYLPVATIPIPKPMPFSIDYVRATTLRSDADVARALDPVQARSERLWLVTTGECRESNPANYDYHCRFLEDYMSRRYRLVRRIAFTGSLARLYVKVSKVSADSLMRRHAN